MLSKNSRSGFPVAVGQFLSLLNDSHRSEEDVIPFSDSFLEGVDIGDSNAAVVHPPSVGTGRAAIDAEKSSGVCHVIYKT